ncbi:MAG: hypothetical protein OXO52_07185 [Rhodospirillales bacterium]|nr:hypothetical protein [Rhodospirillales bacterium]MDE0377815.1 hypothetical protein [Rhodospirillales bacterium]
MSERSVIEAKIKRKEAEIQSLEKKLEAAKVYLSALKDILRAVERAAEDTRSDETALRSGSSVAQAREVILRLGTPVHIDELLRHLGRDLTRQNKASLTGSLAAYVRRGDIFTRTSPNTYGLLELKHFGLDQTPPEPPQDFGSISSPRDLGDDIPF